MSALPSVNVDQLINTRPMTPMQWRIVLLCFLVIALDGFDVAIMGFIAPELARDWAVSNLSLGPVMSAGLIGVAIGALIAGPLADRVGRKPVLICRSILRRTDPGLGFRPQPGLDGGPAAAGGPWPGGGHAQRRDHGQ